MNTASIRQQLISDISAASDDDLKKIYRLHTLVKEEKLNGITWKNLTAEQKNKIETGLEQLKAGKGIPVKKLMSQINKKYGIEVLSQQQSLHFFAYPLHCG